MGGWVRKSPILCWRNIWMMRVMRNVKLIWNSICNAFYWKSLLILKFIYSEKATTFCEILTLLLSYLVPVKSKVNILQNFVAFSEYMNFIILVLICRILPDQPKSPNLWNVASILVCCIFVSTYECKIFGIQLPFLSGEAYNHLSFADFQKGPKCTLKSCVLTKLCLVIFYLNSLVPF